MKRLPRRRLLGFAGAAAFGLIAGACSGEDADLEYEEVTPGANGPADTPSPTEVASGAGGTVWPEPAVLVSRNGLLETTLRVEPGLIPLGASSRWALTVNGTTPGPTMRVKPGDRLRILLENQTAQSTNLHTHGLRVSPSGRADNPFVEVPRGGSFLYEIDIPADHAGGLFWYHPHFHHNVAGQLLAGFFGAIVVEDEFDARPEVTASRERLIIVHDARPGLTQESVLNASMFDQMAGREGSIVLANGVNAAQLETQAGTLERWRILNASPSRFYNFQLEGHDLEVIGVDGGRLPSPAVVDTLGLVPGERAEVLVRPTQPGTYKFASGRVSRGNVGMGMGGGSAVASAAADIFAMVVLGEPSPAAPFLGGAIEVHSPDLNKVDRTRELVLTMQGMSLMIDGRQYDENRVDIRAPLNSTEEWTVRNVSSMDHPFHLHVWPFKVVSQSSGTTPDGWKDVVNVPAGGWVRIRIPFTQTSGKTVYHCHILDHEDMGMMGVIEVS
jgi:FtsP/CotA-like multicopper oxidase with cupredoxin domain